MDEKRGEMMGYTGSSCGHPEIRVRKTLKHKLFENNPYESIAD